MVIIISLLLVMAIALIFIGIFGSIEAGSRRLPLPEEQESPTLKKTKVAAYILGIFPFSKVLLEKLKLDTKIKNRLDAAHIRLSPAEFFNLKLILLFFFGILSFVSTKKLDPLALSGVFVFSYIIPDFWLNRKITQRKHKIAQLLPETVDLLGLCVEAGLDFATALKWLIDKLPLDPMIEELTFVLEEIRWGKPRTQALKDMSKRLNIPEVSSFVQTLVQAERMGTPVAEAFNIISEDTRLQRFHHGERIAMQAPIKILIPLVFCILPVIAIVIGGPILLQFMQGGMFKGF